MPFKYQRGFFYANPVNRLLSVDDILMTYFVGVISSLVLNSCHPQFPLRVCFKPRGGNFNPFTYEMG